MKVETVIKHATSTVGEGPYWEGDSRRLLYVDIVAGDIHRWDSMTGKVETRSFGKSSSVRVPQTCPLLHGGGRPHWEGDSKRLLYVDILAGEIHRWDSRTGKVETRSFGKSSSFRVPQTYDPHLHGGGGSPLGEGLQASAVCRHLGWGNPSLGLQDGEG